MLRAFGGIGIGYFIAEWYKNNSNKIKNLSISISNKFLLTIVEFTCICFIINNLILHKINYKNHIIFIVVFGITIVPFLLK